MRNVEITRDIPGAGTGPAAAAAPEAREPYQLTSRDHLLVERIVADPEASTREVKQYSFVSREHYLAVFRAVGQEHPGDSDREALIPLLPPPLRGVLGELVGEILKSTHHSDELLEKLFKNSSQEERCDALLEHLSGNYYKITELASHAHITRPDLKERLLRAVVAKGHYTVKGCLGRLGIRHYPSRVLASNVFAEDRESVKELDINSFRLLAPHRRGCFARALETLGAEIGYDSSTRALRAMSREERLSLALRCAKVVPQFTALNIEQFGLKDPRDHERVFEAVIPVAADAAADAFSHFRFSSAASRDTGILSLMRHGSGRPAGCPKRFRVDKARREEFIATAVQHCADSFVRGLDELPVSRSRRFSILLECAAKGSGGSAALLLDCPDQFRPRLSPSEQRALATTLSESASGGLLRATAYLESLPRDQLFDLLMRVATSAPAALIGRASPTAYPSVAHLLPRLGVDSRRELANLLQSSTHCVLPALAAFELSEEDEDRIFRASASSNPTEALAHYLSGARTPEFSRVELLKGAIRSTLLEGDTKLNKLHYRWSYLCDELTPDERRDLAECYLEGTSVVDGTTLARIAGSLGLGIVERWAKCDSAYEYADLLHLAHNSPDAVLAFVRDRITEGDVRVLVPFSGKVGEHYGLYTFGNNAFRSIASEAWNHAARVDPIRTLTAFRDYNGVLDHPEPPYSLTQAVLDGARSVSSPEGKLAVASGLLSMGGSRNLEPIRDTVVTEEQLRKLLEGRSTIHPLNPSEIEMIRAMERPSDPAALLPELWRLTPHEHPDDWLVSDEDVIACWATAIGRGVRVPRPSHRFGSSEGYSRALDCLRVSPDDAAAFLVEILQHPENHPELTLTHTELLERLIVPGEAPWSTGAVKSLSMTCARIGIYPELEEIVAKFRPDVLIERFESMDLVGWDVVVALTKIIHDIDPKTVVEKLLEMEGKADEISKADGYMGLMTGLVARAPELVEARKRQIPEHLMNGSGAFLQALVELDALRTARSSAFWTRDSRLVRATCEEAARIVVGAARAAEHVDRLTGHEIAAIVNEFITSDLTSSSRGIAERFSEHPTKHTQGLAVALSLDAHKAAGLSLLAGLSEDEVKSLGAEGVLPLLVQDAPTRQDILRCVNPALVESEEARAQIVMELFAHEDVRNAIANSFASFGIQDPQLLRRLAVSLAKSAPLFFAETVGSQRSELGRALPAEAVRAGARELEGWHLGTLIMSFTPGGETALGRDEALRIELFWSYFRSNALESIRNAPRFEIPETERTKALFDYCEASGQWRVGTLSVAAVSDAVAERFLGRALASAPLLTVQEALADEQCRRILPRYVDPSPAGDVEIAKIIGQALQNGRIEGAKEFCRYVAELRGEEPTAEGLLAAWRHYWPLIRSDLEITNGGPEIVGMLDYLLLRDLLPGDSTIPAVRAFGTKNAALLRHVFEQCGEGLGDSVCEGFLEVLGGDSELVTEFSGSLRAFIDSGYRSFSSRLFLNFDREYRESPRRAMQMLRDARDQGVKLLRGEASPELRSNPFFAEMVYDAYRPVGFTVGQVREILSRGRKDRSEDLWGRRIRSDGYQLSVHDKGDLKVAAEKTLKTEEVDAIATYFTGAPELQEGRTVSARFKEEVGRVLESGGCQKRGLLLWLLGEVSGDPRYASIRESLISARGSDLRAVASRITILGEGLDVVLKDMTSVAVRSHCLDLIRGGDTDSLTDEVRSRQERARAKRHQGLCRVLGKAPTDTLTDEEIFVGMERAVAKAFESDRQLLRRESKKLRAGGVGDARIFHGYISKADHAFFGRAGAGLCTASEDWSWSNPDFLQMIVVDKESNRIVGNIQLHIFEDRERKPAVLARLNPTVPILSKVDGPSLAAEMMCAVHEFAAENGLVVYLPEQTSWHQLTNRWGTDFEISLKGYYGERISHNVKITASQTVNIIFPSTYRPM